MMILRHLLVACISCVVLSACVPASTPPSTFTPPLQSTNTPASVSAPSPTALPSSILPTFDQPAIQVYDGHLHYSSDAWLRYPVSAIQQILDRVGIKRALVSSTPNEGTLRLYQADPARIVPELRPYRTRGDMSDWFANPQIVTMIDEELQRGVYRGIGEFHLAGDDAKTQVVKRIVDLAVERNLPLHAHSDEVAVENLFAANPRVKIMWAHTGFTTPTSRIAELFERYPNLWAELSYRSDITENGKLSSEWRAIFLRFPDRFIYGSDTWIESRWEQLPDLVATARGWLADLPIAVAEKIAYRNFEALYGK